MISRASMTWCSQGRPRKSSLAISNRNGGKLSNWREELSLIYGDWFLLKSILLTTTLTMCAFIFWKSASQDLILTHWPAGGKNDNTLKYLTFYWKNFTIFTASLTLSIWFTEILTWRMSMELITKVSWPEVLNLELKLLCQEYQSHKVIYYSQLLRNKYGNSNSSKLYHWLLSLRSSFILIQWL